MNELDLQRRMLADPGRLPAEAFEALARSPRLAAQHEGLLRADEEMHHWLTQAVVPDGLADRIILRARYGTRSRWRYARAASVLAALAAAVAFLVPSEPALELAMIDHVVAQDDEWSDDVGVEPAVLRVDLADLGVALRASGGRIRHLARCVIAGREGRHFTMEGPHGVVTFVVLPGTDADGESILLQRGATRGLFMRRAGNTIGVFTRDRGSRGELEALLQDAFA